MRHRDLLFSPPREDTVAPVDRIGMSKLLEHRVPPSIWEITCLSYFLSDSSLRLAKEIATCYGLGALALMTACRSLVSAQNNSVHEEEARRYFVLKPSVQ